MGLANSMLDCRHGFAKRRVSCPSGATSNPPTNPRTSSSGQIYLFRKTLDKVLEQMRVEVFSSSGGGGSLWLNVTTV